MYSYVPKGENDSDLRNKHQKNIQNSDIANETFLQASFLLNRHTLAHIAPIIPYMPYRDKVQFVF